MGAGAGGSCSALAGRAGYLPGHRSASRPVLKPTDRAVRAYYETLERYRAVGAAHEQAVKTAFHDVLQAAAGAEWTLVPEFTTKGRTGKTVRYDGALRDPYNYTLGYWEAKDSADDLEREVQAKIARGYSLQNTLFQAPRRALLYQDGRLVLDADLDDAGQLADALALFVGYHEPAIEQFHAAVAEFRAAIPDLARGLLAQIEAARTTDPDFRAAFEAFVTTVREAVNPTVATAAVEEMLVQHLLTERVVRTVFGNPDFARRNAIAAEIEKVIDALTARHVSRTAFLGRLDRFYRAIEDAAEGITDWAAKQDFLNTVYEQFFQGFSDRVADTHGIVYTPQPLVDFMVRSADALLARHFTTPDGQPQTLATPGVHVLDPFVGTGNFLVRVIEQIPAPDLPAKYGAGGRPAELHANEVLLLPYYIASLNIEHAFREKTGRYEPFEGIVLVDTFDMVEGKTVGMFAAENTERAMRQRQAPIRVVIGNPPYNAHQVNANDANQNRTYPTVRRKGKVVQVGMDERVSSTYAAASSAQNKNALADPYVKAFRWASDRVGEAGIVAYITNRSFVDAHFADGMRDHLLGDFDEIWVVDLGGDVRKNPRFSGSAHNVFGIQTGVAIAFLVRTSGRHAPDRRGVLRYAAAGADWKKEQKYDWLAAAGDLDGLEWRTLTPNDRHDWLTDDMADEWDDLLPMASQTEKASDEANETTLFDQYSRGVETGRDAWVYDFDRKHLAQRVERLVDTYNAQVVKWQRKGGKSVKLESVVTTDDREIKWTRGLKQSVKAGNFLDADPSKIRPALYRPFVPKWLYFEQPLVYLLGQFPAYFPTPDKENRVIWLKVGSAWPMFALMVNRPADVLPQGGSQAFPFYVYREDGTRAENLTDWALGQFQSHYAAEHLPDPSLARIGNPSASTEESARAITKWDVFHYAYAVLHHPAYRARYAADLRRTLPRLPLAPAFWPLADAGRALADLHVGFEAAPEAPLALVHTPGAPLSYRIEKMAWADAGKATLRLNDALALTGIPPEAHAYRLGTRSALEWLVDQLRVRTDARSGIVHDPNDAADAERVARLVRQVTTVSVETARIVAALPGLGLPAA